MYEAPQSDDVMNIKIKSLLIMYEWVLLLYLK